MSHLEDEAGKGNKILLQSHFRSSFWVAPSAFIHFCRQQHWKLIGQSKCLCTSFVTKSLRFYRCFFFAAFSHQKLENVFDLMLTINSSKIEKLQSIFLFYCNFHEQQWPNIFDFVNSWIDFLSQCQCRWTDINRHDLVHKFAFENCADTFRHSFSAIWPKRLISLDLHMSTRPSTSSHLSFSVAKMWRCFFSLSTRFGSSFNSCEEHKHTAFNWHSKTFRPSQTIIGCKKVFRTLYELAPIFKKTLSASVTSSILCMILSWMFSVESCVVTNCNRKIWGKITNEIETKTCLIIVFFFMSHLCMVFAFHGKLLHHFFESISFLQIGRSMNPWNAWNVFESFSNHKLKFKCKKKIRIAQNLTLQWQKYLWTEIWNWKD